MIGSRRGSRAILFTTFAALLLGCGVVSAQDAASQAPSAGQSPIDQDIALLRKNLRDQRKQIIAANLPLTGSEAEKFWPIYEQYVGNW
jgi:hypothetical protein